MEVKMMLEIDCFDSLFACIHLGKSLCSSREKIILLIYGESKVSERPANILLQFQ